jgi:hypothetical protein
MSDEMERFICPSCISKYKRGNIYYLCKSCMKVIKHPSDGRAYDHHTLKSCPNCGASDWANKSLKEYIQRGVYHCNILNEYNVYCPTCKVAPKANNRDEGFNLVKRGGELYIKCECGNILTQDKCDYCKKMFDLPSYWCAVYYANYPDIGWE